MSSEYDEKPRAPSVPTSPPPPADFSWSPALGSSPLPIAIEKWSARAQRWMVWRRTGEIKEVTLRSGRVVKLAIWESNCATCGEAFQRTTPTEPAGMMMSEFHSVINCPLHRLPTKPKHIDALPPRAED
jgi:hypothetical protein